MCHAQWREDHLRKAVLPRSFPKIPGGVYRGFAAKHRNWCLSYLKQPALRMAARHRRMVLETQNPVCTVGPGSGEVGARSSRSRNGATFSNTRRAGRETNTVQYLGIASDEPERIIRHTKPGFALPLVETGWDEAYCRRWCEDNDLLSPIYTTASRGGCWFCHNQGVDQLRILRKAYPEYWQLMLKWDKDSPVTFKADGHTVHDFEARFAAEDAGLIDPQERFLWEMIGRKIIKPRVELPGQMRMEGID